MILILNNLDVISFFLAIASVAMGYWFWKNPIDTDFQNEHIVREEDDIKYVIGKDHKGWKVKRINYDEQGELSTKIISWASISNNPKVKVPPITLNELDKLNYD